MSSSIRKRKTSGNHNSHNSSFEQSSITMTQEGYYVQEGEYNVEKILEMKEEKGITYYRVKWEGYPESESTWEPISHLQNVLDLIEDFQIELIKKDSLKDFQEIKQIPYFEPIRRFETDYESQEQKGLFEDDNVFRKRRMEERGNGEDREIREKVLGMEYFGESMNRLNYQEMDLFKAKVVVKKEKMEVESNLSKKDKDMEREKRRERGSQLRREEVKQGKESINQKENSLRKIEFKSEQGVYQRKSEVTPIRQEEMLIEEMENAEGKKSVKVKTSKKSVGEGSYKLKDKPKQILTIKEKKKGGFWFLVEWQRRKDGTKPENSYVENEEMKQNDPYFLLSFYESKIIVLPKDKSKERMNVDDLKNLINEKSSKSGSKSQVHTIDTDEDDELYSSGTKSSKVVVTSSGLKKKDPV